MSDVEWIEGASVADVADYVAARLVPPRHGEVAAGTADEGAAARDDLQCVPLPLRRFAPPPPRGRDFRVAVPGGTTPWPILADLAQRNLPWTDITLTLTDDRQVPHDHTASNFGRLQQIFTDTPAQLTPLTLGPTELFSLVWLGMGEDGHIASLFPQMEAVDTPGPAVIATRPIPLPPEAPFDRLSLNMAALTDTQTLMLVLRGQPKKHIIQAAIAGNTGLPIGQLLAKTRCPVTIFWSEI